MKNLKTGIKIRKAKNLIPVTCPGINIDKFEREFIYQQRESYRLGKEVQKIENGYTQLNLFLNWERMITWFIMVLHLNLWERDNLGNMCLYRKEVNMLS